MSGDPHDVAVKYGDGEHPRDLLKTKERKRKLLLGVLKGKFSHLTGDEIIAYKAGSKEEIHGMIRTYDQRIRELKGGLWKHGKSIS